jgi:hypothetical protein
MGNFYIDVIKKDPRFNSIDLIKDVELLEPVTRAKVEAVIKDAEANGHKLIVLETYRSQARQEFLFKRGATQLEHVGCHGYGLACDLGFLKPDGTVNWNADYTVLCHIATAHQLISGHDWGKPSEPHSFRDNDHVQRISVADQEKLFAGEFYPDESYNPYEHL